MQKYVVDFIYAGNVAAQDTHPYSVLIFDCKCLMHSFEEAHLRHIHCERNFSHSLEKLFFGCIFRICFSPPFVVNQLLTDI